jgi:hypothetical protein
MKALVLTMAACIAAFAADVCPASTEVIAGAASGGLGWSSRAAPVGKRQCVSNEAHNSTSAAIPVWWPDAGIAMAVVQKDVEMAICCFSHESAQPGTVRLGADHQSMAVTTHREVVKPRALDVDEHEYPDLIEDDARHRTVSIRGTLWADGAALLVDVVLKCSASQFADQFAYEFSLVNRGDEAQIDWDLLRQMQAKASASVQPVAHGKVWVFLSADRPTEALATVEVRSKKGTLAGRFQFDGFGAAKR